MTKEELIEFEEEIAALFNAGKIRAPFICIMEMKSRSSKSSAPFGLRTGYSAHGGRIISVY